MFTVFEKKNEKMVGFAFFSCKKESKVGWRSDVESQYQSFKYLAGLSQMKIKKQTN